jgi:hypothetical protein
VGNPPSSYEPIRDRRSPLERGSPETKPRSCGLNPRLRACSTVVSTPASCHGRWPHSPLAPKLWEPITLAKTLARKHERLVTCPIMKIPSRVGRLTNARGGSFPSATSPPAPALTRFVPRPMLCNALNPAPLRWLCAYDRALHQRESSRPGVLGATHGQDHLLFLHHTR